MVGLLDHNRIINFNKKTQAKDLLIPNSTHYKLGEMLSNFPLHSNDHRAKFFTFGCHYSTHFKW